jgi:glycerol-3-phosphate dehydrogenase (NAD(P)+)
MMFELKLGDNAHSTLLTIGLNEMKKVASTFGAKSDTFLNFACLGDLILTASSQKSRNFTFGRKVVELGSSSVAKANYHLTVEGMLAAKIAYEICQARAIDSQLFKIAYEII